MANGYIGKISAVVTANTSDLERKLSGAVKNVDVFANRLAASIERSSKSAQDSLNSIFTPLQRLERNLQAGLSGNVFKRDNVEQYVRSVRQAVSISEQINKPLASGAAAFQKLSLEVQAGFLPALNRAQSAAVNLSNTLQQQGGISERTFGGVEHVVNRTTEALRRLGQAQQLAVSGFSGDELQFTSPRAFQALQSAAASTSRAAELPPSALADGNIQRQVQRLQQFRNLIAQTVAEVEEIRLRPNVDQTALAAAERRLDNIVETTRRAQEELDRTARRPAAEEAALRSEQEARLAVANSLLQVDQRESQLTSLEGLASTRDATGRSIQERARDIANAAEATERRRQAEAALRSEQEARLEVANSLLQVDQRESELLSLEGTASGLGDRLARQGRDRVTGLTGSTNLDANDRFGPQAQRDIDALATRVGTVRQQLETLPNSVRTRFVPELQRAQEQLIRLQNAPAATVTQIEQAAQRVQRLEQAARRASAAFNFRNSFGGAGLRGIEEGLNQQALGGYTAQLQLLQRTLAGTSQAARGPAVVAFNNLRNAIADAMERGTLETEQTRRVLQQLTREAVQATARVAGVSADRLGQQLQRAGDIARGAAGNVGLAVQQAIFAVDDFFSVTGGLDQRIRAAGNNISQLAFILGGTYGLAAGVAITVTGQLVAGLIRYYNEGRTADDVTKALNDSLERQIDLAKELKDALRDAFEGVIEGGFSEQTRELREFRRELDEIRKKQREQREEAAINANPGVVAARQEVNAAQRAVEEAQAPGQFILARQRLERARAQEQAARQAALVQPGAEVGESVRRSIRLEEAARTDFESGVVIRGEEVARRRQRAEDALARAEQQRVAGDQAGAINTQREEIRTRIQELSDPSISGQVEAQQAIAELQSILDRLELGLVAAIDNVVATSLENSFAAGREIARVQSRAGEAGAFGAQAAIDQANAARDAAARQLEEASRIPDVAQRQAAVAEASAGLAEADRNAQEVANKFNFVIQALDRFAEALEIASQEVQRNLSSAQSAAGDARAADLGRSTPQSQAQRQQAEADLRRQQELASAAEEEIAAARERFGQRSSEFFGVEQDVEERRAGARQRGIDLQAQLRDRIDEIADIFGLRPEDTPGADELRARFGVEDLFGLEALQAELLNEFNRIGASFGELSSLLDAELQAAGGELVASFRRIAEIDRLLQTQGVLGEGQREELVRERARIEQQAVEQDAAVQAAVNESTREEQQRRQAERGRQLAQTPGQRAAESLTNDLEAVRQFFGRQAEEGSGLVDFEAQKAAQDRLIQDAFRSQAPAIAGLADSVANAVLQGPSRAALNATDVSTVEGARELNRLIRGDDAARDQNLEELRRQSGKLDELIQAVKDNGGDVAN